MKRRKSFNKYLQGSHIESTKVTNENGSRTHSKKLAQIIAISSMCSAFSAFSGMPLTKYSKMDEENENKQN